MKKKQKTKTNKGKTKQAKNKTNKTKKKQEKIIETPPNRHGKSLSSFVFCSESLWAEPVPK